MNVAAVAHRVVGAVLVILAAAMPTASAQTPAPAPPPAQPVAPRPIDIPPWFTPSFLDLQDELQAATQEKKRLLLYFGQDGCPYCRRLMEVNFSQRAIVDKTRANFRAIALDIWGDLEVTWTDGRRGTEKQLARQLQVQFTPTLLFLDEQGRIHTRLNGYWPPHRFEAALDYVITRQSGRLSLAEYLEHNAREAAREELNDEAFLMKPPFDLRRKAGGKPLAVLFETRSCRACDEMHREGFQRAEMRVLIPRFDIARFALNDASEIITPSGRKLSASAWARELKVNYTPTVVYFDAANREVFRFEGYLRPFHLVGAFDYVAQGAYRTQPEFQRFLQNKAERLR
ncbi:MAG TPA: thioredoxin fold domain-containing protein, partial [Burkholderiaceae bacterium]|nr:thioredoxin fold domain-containing protein [Burkholderiaceae bacterium]